MAALQAASITLSSRPAYALFGEEDWLSGQNALLAEILGAHLEELTKISTLIANVKLVAKATNESLALARTVRRVYDLLRTYDVEDLVRDARRGLYRAIPELRQTDREIGALIENGRALEEGEGAFFSLVTFHDGTVSRAARRTFEHGYQSAIWPQVFPGALDHVSDPSPVELMIQHRYQRTADQKRRAIQRTAMGVLSEKVKAYVEDAEQKPNAALRAAATNAQVNFQSMQQLTELRNLKEQSLAEKEAQHIQDTALRLGFSKVLSDRAGDLFYGAAR